MVMHSAVMKVGGGLVWRFMCVCVCVCMCADMYLQGVRSGRSIGCRARDGRFMCREGGVWVSDHFRARVLIYRICNVGT